MITKNKLTSILSQRINWVIIIVGMILFLGISGYVIILFGGKLIVDEEGFILDATTTIETTEGNIISEIYNEKRSPVALEQVPEHVQDAFLAIEDRRFYDHAGVDMKAIIRAVYRDIIAMEKVEGASTITQQLAKNLFLTNDKSWLRKTKEVMVAIYIERRFAKSEILELYLNEIYFGNGVYGVEAASQHLFSKPIEEISIANGALLAGLAKAPNGYSPINHPNKALTRRNVVLNVMNKAHMITTDVLEEEQTKTLGLEVREKQINPFVDSYVDLVMKEAAEKHELSAKELKQGGYRVVVNMNETAQRIAYEAFKEDAFFPGSAEGVEGAFIMIDPHNGKIVTAIGARDYMIGDLNHVTVKRQPGSTFKPLAVYGPAMMKDEYEPYSLVRDDEIDHDGYQPSNYGEDDQLAVTIYDALLKSKNTSAVWLLDQIGIDYSKKYLKKLGMDIPDKGLAIALGGLSEGVTPLHMASGYGALANNGKIVEAHTIERIYNARNDLMIEVNPLNEEVFNAQVAWDMTEILSENVKEGTASAGEYSSALAGKTGTTEHPFVKGENKDIWFVGYTPEYVSAMWMGYDHSDEEHYMVGGSEFPTKLTKKILSSINEKTPLATEFTKPADVIELAKPIELPLVTDVQAKYIFGGLSVIKGKVSWTGPTEEQYVYRIYQDREGIDKRLGEVNGKTEFIIDNISLLSARSFYVVPYNPLTKIEGTPSEVVEISM